MQLTTHGLLRQSEWHINVLDHTKRENLLLLVLLLMQLPHRFGTPQGQCQEGKSRQAAVRLALVDMPHCRRDFCSYIFLSTLVSKCF